MSTPFTKLAPFPFSIGCSNVVKINQYEFVTATNARKFDANDKHDLGLYKYNTIANEWSLFLKYPKETLPKELRATAHYICFDEKNQLIYMCGNSRKMVIFDLNTMTIDIHPAKLSVGFNPVLIMIKDKCHIILGSDSRYHHAWNSKSKQLEAVFFNNWSTDGLYGHGVVDIKSKNKLLLFGGFNRGILKCEDAIWEYDYIQQKLDKTQWKLPAEICYFGWTLSNDEQYLIIFGGEHENGRLLKNIYIADLSANDLKFYASNIEMYDSEKAYAVSIVMENSDILIEGYMHEKYLKEI